MLIAMNSGIPGLCTIHANSNQEALKKLTTLPLLAGGNISSDFVHGLVRTSMKILVHCSRSSNGKRSVSSIMVFGDADALTLREVQL
jgi:pilus assembly protein CpaF